MSSSEAYDWGLANRVVAEAELSDAATRTALQIAANAPLAVQAIKKINRESQTLSIEQAYKAMQAGTYTTYNQMLTSADAHEGINAYSEGRAPI